MDSLSDVYCLPLNMQKQRFQDDEALSDTLPQLESRRLMSSCPCTFVVTDDTYLRKVVEYENDAVSEM